MPVAGLVEGKVALVSGIGPGMGRDISLLLAEHGAKVALGARTVSKCEEVGKEIDAAGGESLPLALDITDADSCQAAVDATVERFGRIDILVNNAFHDGDFKYFLKADFDSWRQTMDVNLWGDGRGITSEEVYAEVAEENALKYLPHSSEIAGAVLFLASDLAKPITGQALHVNAGHWFEGF